MGKNLLKKSGIITVIVTFAAVAFWFGFAKISLGAYNEKTLTRLFLAEDSEVFKTIVIEVGTDTVARIIAGTSSMVRTGTATYPGQPRIEYSGVTGKWSFKNSAGTETVAFGTVSASYVAAEIGSTTANYVLKNNGSSAGQLATDATLAGSTTIGTGSTFTAGGSTFEGAKVGYLADVEQNIGAHIDSKLTKIGTPTNYITMIQGDGKTGTKSASFSAGSGMALTATYQDDGALNLSYAASGTGSAKADVQEGGTVTVSGAEFLNYNNADFDTVINGLGADIALSAVRRGTSTATANYTTVSGSDASNLLGDWYNAGMIIGSAYGSTSVLSSTNTIIPIDNSIPQNSEGTEIMSVAYTPKKIGSTMHVLIVASIIPSAGGVATVALFVDSASDALTCTSYNNSAASATSGPLIAKYATTTADLSSRTYKVRYGCASAAYPIYLNQGYDRTLGGIMRSSIAVYETKN